MTNQIFNDGPSSRFLPSTLDARRQSTLGVSRRQRDATDSSESSAGIDDFIEISDSDIGDRVNFSDFENLSRDEQFTRQRRFGDASVDQSFAAGIYRAAGIQLQRSFVGSNLDLVG